MVEVVGWLTWNPGHPDTIGPGQAEQTKPYRRRSFVRLGAPLSPLGFGPLPGGWADGEEMTSQGVLRVRTVQVKIVGPLAGH